MTWHELLHNEDYLMGYIVCIHHRVVFPQLEIKGTEEDFQWARRPDMALVAIGPVDKFSYSAESHTFSVNWKSLNIITPDFLLGEELRGFEETGIPDGVILSTKYQAPSSSTSGILYLGTDDEVTDVYLLPAEDLLLMFVYGS